MNPSSPETKSPAEVAKELVEQSVCADVGEPCEETVGVHYNDLIAAITTALENERERCAKIADAEAQDATREEAVSNDDFDRGRSWAATAIATAIRGK